MRRHAPDLFSLLLGLAFAGAAVLVALDERLPLWFGADSPGPLVIALLLVVVAIAPLQWWLQRRGRRGLDPNNGHVTPPT